jgi:hypothetical protein
MRKLDSLDEGLNVEKPEIRKSEPRAIRVGYFEPAR